MGESYITSSPLNIASNSESIFYPVLHFGVSAYAPSGFNGSLCVVDISTMPAFTIAYWTVSKDETQPLSINIGDNNHSIFKPSLNLNIANEYGKYGYTIIPGISYTYSSGNLVEYTIGNLEIQDFGFSNSDDVRLYDVKIITNTSQTTNYGYRLQFTIQNQNSHGLTTTYYFKWILACYMSSYAAPFIP